MFLKKVRQKPDIYEGLRGDIQVRRGSDVEKQLAMTGLTPEDLGVIKFLKPFVAEKIHEIVNRFYDNLETEPSLLQIINNHSSVEALKGTLRQHITEMFQGTVDEEYLDKRIMIANMHVRIGLPTKWYVCSFQELLLSIVEIIEEKIEDREQYFPAVKAVTKLLNLEQQLVLEAYDLETARIKQAAEAQKGQIQERVFKESQNLAAVSEQTNASFQELTAQSGEIVSFANSGTELAAMAEERAEKGMQLMNLQTQGIASIDGSLDEINTDMELLLGIMKQMQDIISLVTNIADQTNLLSLNAAIEAARAGEHGKGFSVVAGEVRKLSDETKESVSKVRQLISNSTAQVEKLTGAMEIIKAEMGKGTRNMQKTKDHFLQIHQTMTETKDQNKKIEQEITAFVNVLNELGAAFEEVASAADNLTVVSQELTN
ncbi:globin-coupled sensor protein [Evansella clarkii]|uniref:globin-coupled sensor protein n=1 Tax=Evansella clarkii TaxID=79879 RepID=UPI000B43F143|nr:globin-coupled sensor protein [Evansella clarkii]